MTEQLTDQDLADAAAGDVNVLAALMLIGSSAFAAVNLWIGTMGWLAAVLSVASTLAWSLGLWRRSSVTTSFVKIGFGLGGLAAPVLGIAGIVIAVLGFAWGWAVLGGAVVYFGFSLLGLEIIERAYQNGVIEEFF